MTYVLTLEWQRCPDGVQIIRDDAGRAVSIRNRSGERETYRRRLHAPDDFIVTEFLNTGDSGPRKKDLPVNELTALAAFISNYGVLEPFSVYDEMVQLTEGASVLVEGNELTGGQSLVRRHEERLPALLAVRRDLRKIWDAFERQDWAEAISEFNKCVHARPGILKPLMRYHDDKPALMLRVETLYGFMLMEAAVFIGGGCAVLRCQQCGIIFQTGSGTGRRNTAMYCSNRCRVAAQRKPAQKG